MAEDFRFESSVMQPGGKLVRGTPAKGGAEREFECARDEGIEALNEGMFVSGGGHPYFSGVGEDWEQMHAEEVEFKACRNLAVAQQGGGSVE